MNFGSGSGSLEIQTCAYTYTHMYTVSHTLKEGPEITFISVAMLCTIKSIETSQLGLRSKEDGAHCYDEKKKKKMDVRTYKTSCMDYITYIHLVG